MKPRLFIPLLMTFVLSAGFSPISEAQNITSKFMVSFADKSGTPYQITNPQAYLGQRAIQRRLKYSIPVTEQDLPVSPQYLDTLTNRGFLVLAASKWLNAALIDSKDSVAVMDLLNLPFVTAVDLVYYTNTAKGGGSKGTQKFDTDEELLRCLKSAPEAKGSKLSGINYGYGYTQANMLGATYLHQLGYTGEDMIIAVLDAGFHLADTLPVFDSLHLQNRILATHNFVKPNETVYQSSEHGMMVLSTMGGNLPGTLVGTAPHASFMLLLSEDVATEFPVEEFYWALAAEYADSAGADLINSSLGYTTFDLPVLSHTYADMNGITNISSRAASWAAQRGLLVVASAGNGGGSSWFYISSPGDADSIITAGAVDISGQYAGFSSTGPTADKRVKPDVASVGLGSSIASSGGGSTNGNGTSFSSPIMCGALACLWQANDSLPNIQIIEAVRRSGHQWFHPDTLLGYGIPNLAVAHLVLGGIPVPNIKDKKFKVAPNPFNNQFFITFYSTDTQQVTIELYDLRGQLQFVSTARKNNGLNVLPVNGLEKLASGAYILKLVEGNLVITQKIIRQ